jgi:hypothetical protein
MNEEKRNACRILVGRPERQIPPIRLTHVDELIKLKFILSEIG